MLSCETRHEALFFPHHWLYSIRDKVYFMQFQRNVSQKNNSHHQKWLHLLRVRLVAKGIASPQDFLIKVSHKLNVRIIG